MNAPTESNETVSAFSSVFFATTADDGPAFSEEDITNFLPLVFLRAMKSGASNSSPLVERFLAEFAGRIGVGPDASAEQVQEKIAAHYRAHPINPALAATFERTLREQTALHGAVGAMNRLAEFVGERIKNDGYRLDRPKPEGSLSAGPLARFQAADTLAKNKNK